MKTLGILFVSGIIIAGCSSGSTTMREGDRMRAEPTAVKVEQRDIVGYQMLQGDLYVPPTAEAVVRSPYSGAIQQVMTTVGQRVRKGEVLAQLSLPDQQQYYAEAQATVKAAETAYANAQTTYNAPVRDAEKLLAQARASERAFRAQTDPNGDASGLVQARQAREAAEAAVIQAKAEASNNLMPFKQQLEQARAALKAAQAGVKQGSVSTPISGTVLEVGVSSGQNVQSDSPIFRVVNLADIKVRAEMDSADADLLKERRAVVVTFTGLEDKPFDGRVTEVRTLPKDGGVRYQAVIDFKNDDGLVKPGMKVKMLGIKTGEVKDAIAVPADSVYADATGKPTVNVLKGQDWVPTVVEPGLSDGTYTQVKSGIQVGDTVQLPGIPQTASPASAKR